MIDARLIRATESDIRAIGFETPDTHFHVRQEENTGHWFETDPPRSRVDSAKVAELLREVTSLNGKHFTSLRQPTHKEEQPRSVLKLVLKSREITLEQLGSCAQAPADSRVRVSGDTTTEACADFAPLLARFKQEAESWRDTRLFTLQTDQVESIRTSLGGEIAELTRDGTAFRFGRANAVNVDIETGNEYLSELLATRGQYAPDPSHSTHRVFESSDYLQVSSSVVGKQGEYNERLFLGPFVAGGNRLVQRAEDQTILVISPATAQLLQMNARSLRSRSLIHVDPSQIQDIEAWVQNKTVKLDQTDKVTLQEALAGLRVQSWQSSKPVHPSMHVRIVFSIAQEHEPTRRRNLHMDLGPARLNRAWLDDQDQTFEPTSAFLDSIRAVLKLRDQP